VDTRKDYVAPAIVAEDVLEQTSLACNASAPFRQFNGSCFGGQAVMPNFAPGLPCLNNVAKNGAFVGQDCQFTVGINAIVTLS
jgi:hypothetical protein